MKGNKLKGMRFIIGTFNEKIFKGKQIYTVFKKSRVVPLGNLILQKFGHIWLKVVYADKLKSWKGQVYNDTKVKTMKDLKIALSQFVEEKLLNYTYK